jgi:hypothetical protein
VRKAFAILFALTMVYELEESWLLYAGSIKAQINKQFKVWPQRSLKPHSHVCTATFHMIPRRAGVPL